mmetsp:Transcript_13118/g.25414  ORF Transcript_13118/g.25414 Transcript_13118/m.25414 type:complete len:359 (+) Transcript_13118:37-1113(+)
MPAPVVPLFVKLIGPTAVKGLAQVMGGLTVGMVFQRTLTGYKALPYTSKLAVRAGVALPFLFCGMLWTDNEYRDWYRKYVMLVQDYGVNFIHGERKRQLFSSLHNRALEVGCSNGDNFRFFPSSLTSWTGLQDNKACDAKLELVAAAFSFPPMMLDTRHGSLLTTLKSIPTNSQLSVVCGHSLSRMESEESKAALQQILRVLKPGGRFYFVENSLNHSGLSRYFYKAVAPLSRFFLHTNCAAPIAEQVHAAGFASVHMEHWPRSVNPEDPRKGVSLIEFIQDDGQVDRSSSSSTAEAAAPSPSPERKAGHLSSFPGGCAVIGGVCVKEQYKNLQRKAAVDKSREIAFDVHWRPARKPS